MRINDKETTWQGVLCRSFKAPLAKPDVAYFSAAVTAGKNIVFSSKFMGIDLPILPTCFRRIGKPFNRCLIIVNVMTVEHTTVPLNRVY